MAGCANDRHHDEASHDATHHAAHADDHDHAPVPGAMHTHGGGRLHFYRRDPSDPPWLVHCAELHGHLGPWVTAGGLIGQDALHRLDTPGHWMIEVICWMPPEHQRPPFSCMLDGLQFTSGATFGKRNIRFAYSDKVVKDGRTVVYVIRRPEGDRPCAGIAYHVNDRLAALATNVPAERLESASREIARHTADEMFDIRTLSEKEAEAALAMP